MARRTKSGTGQWMLYLCRPLEVRESSELRIQTLTLALIRLPTPCSQTAVEPEVRVERIGYYGEEGFKNVDQQGDARESLGLGLLVLLVQILESRDE